MASGYATSYTPSDLYPSEAQNQEFGAALGRAIRHAQRVSEREHIKATRADRVNQFCTSLRRELGYVETRTVITLQQRQHFTGLYCNASAWNDIGVPSGIGITEEASKLLKHWLVIAKRLSHGCSAQAEIILGDLEELERGLVVVKEQAREADRINQEGEAVIDQLCAVFS